MYWSFRESRVALVFVALLSAQGAPSAFGQSASGQPATAPVHLNRLAESNNPYLQSHAHNPVDWYPWGSDAIAKAKRENKPIFLSVGYSTCYWCHVAERTIYSDPRIATLMNEWFVNIKVDREQRPDIDQIYMTATQLLTGRGGWPNNVFFDARSETNLRRKLFSARRRRLRATRFPDDTSECP